MKESLQLQISIPDTSDQLNDMRANLLQSGLNTIDWPINKTANIVVLGLSGAGKSTLIEFIRVLMTDYPQQRMITQKY